MWNSLVTSVLQSHIVKFWLRLSFLSFSHYFLSILSSPSSRFETAVAALLLPCHPRPQFATVFLHGLHGAVLAVISFGFLFESMEFRLLTSSLPSLFWRRPAQHRFFTGLRSNRCSSLPFSLVSLFSWPLRLAYLKCCCSCCVVLIYTFIYEMRSILN